MRPTLITSQDRVRTFLASWNEWVAQYHPHNALVASVTPALLALDIERATVEDVEKALAPVWATGWHLGSNIGFAGYCHGCGNQCKRLVMVGDEPDYESATANLCESCVREALAVVTGA